MNDHTTMLVFFKPSGVVCVQRRDLSAGIQIKSLVVLKNGGVKTTDSGSSSKFWKHNSTFFPAPCSLHPAPRCPPPLLSFAESYCASVKVSNEHTNRRSSIM